MRRGIIGGAADPSITEDKDRALVRNHHHRDSVNILALNAVNVYLLKERLCAYPSLQVSNSCFADYKCSLQLLAHSGCIALHVDITSSASNAGNWLSSHANAGLGCFALGGDTQSLMITG